MDSVSYWFKHVSLSLQYLSAECNPVEFWKNNPEEPTSAGSSITNLCTTAAHIPTRGVDANPDQNVDVSSNAAIRHSGAFEIHIQTLVTDVDDDSTLSSKRNSSSCATHNPMTNTSG